MSFAADILPRSGLLHQVEFLIDMMRDDVCRFQRAHANAPASEKATLLNRLTRILRWVFVLLAANLQLSPARRRAPRARSRRSVWRPRMAPAHGARAWRPSRSSHASSWSTTTVPTARNRRA